MTLLHPEGGSTKWNPLNEVHLLSKSDVPSFSMTGDIKTFKQLILLILNSLEFTVILLNLGTSKLTLLLHSY